MTRPFFGPRFLRLAVLPLQQAWRMLAVLGALMSMGPNLQAQGNAAAPAAGQTPVPVERFFEHPRALAAKLSPSGRLLAFTSAAGATRVGLLVVKLSESSPVLRVAQFSDVDVARFEWVGEDRLVFSVADLESGSADERRHAPGLYSVQADGTALQQLIARELPPSGASAPRATGLLDAFHTLLHVPQAQATVMLDEVVVGRLSRQGDGSTAVLPLWLNVRDGRWRPMRMPDAPAGVLQWWFDSQGVPLAALAQQEGVLRLFGRRHASQTWTPLAEAPATRGLPFTPLAVDDAGQLYITQPRGPRGEAVLTRFDHRTLKPEPRALVQLPGFDFHGSIVPGRPGAVALGVRAEASVESTLWLDESMQRMQAVADERFPDRINRLSCSRCGEPDMRVVVRSFSDRDPGSLWLYQAETGRWRAISTMMPGIDARQMARVDFHRITARDGHALPVWVTRPQGVAPGHPAPAVVLVHGGPWQRGGYWHWSAWEQFLASRGYLVISPEFRGSTGYGSLHYSAGRKQWGQAMQDDVADALNWAREEGLASDQACIAGASYGGYAALMGLVRHPELYRCAVAWVAPTDLQLMVQGNWSATEDSGGSSSRQFLSEWVGDPQKDAALLRAHSPLAQAARIKAPVLLGMGEADTRVPLAHGERLRQALTAAGRPPEWVSYPDEGHHWRRVATKVDFARRMEAFLARHLGPAPTASVDPGQR